MTKGWVELALKRTTRKRLVIRVSTKILVNKMLMSEYMYWVLLREKLPPELCSQVYAWALKALRKEIREKMWRVLEEKEIYPRVVWPFMRSLLRPPLYLWVRFIMENDIVLAYAYREVDDRL